MDSKDTVVQLRLLKNELPYREKNTDYWFKAITVENFNLNIEGIEKVISYHYQDINWENTPSILKVLERLQYGSKCNLVMYKNEVIGWHWYHNSIITKDWTTEYKKLKKGEMYVGGALISQKARPSILTPFICFRQGFEHILNIENKDTIYLYSDYWNKPSIKLCKKCGFTEYNFL